MIPPTPHGATQVAMMHSARCGSTVVGNMLDQHSRIRWAGEIYLRYARTHHSEHPKDVLAAGFNESRAAANAEIFGFEIKYLPTQHLTKKCLNLSLKQCVNRLTDLGVSHFIGLNRRNFLRQTISLCVGKKKGYWHSSDEQSPELVTIEVRKLRISGLKTSLLGWFDHLEKSHEKLISCLPDSSLMLTYEEDILGDPFVAYRKVCEFLGVEDESPEIDLKRTNPFAIQDMLGNYEEVASALRGTRHEWMLED